MARFEQFEIWQLNGARWEFVASFPDLEVAMVMARGRMHRVRLMQVTYEDSQPVQQQVLTEIGTTRDWP